MDVLDEKKLEAAGINVVDRAQQDLISVIDYAVKQLDGWTLTINGVTITLNKSK